MIGIFFVFIFLLVTPECHPNMEKFGSILSSVVPRIFYVLSVKHWAVHLCPSEEKQGKKSELLCKGAALPLRQPPASEV
jgi:hypothetical protein